MRLYYFTSTTYGLQAIHNRRLKIARILELNDPFEFLSPVFEDRQSRAIANRWKAQMSKRFGVLCMSTTWQHPLLWGHYGDKHAGICLSFDVLEQKAFTAVEYVQARPTLQDLNITDLHEMDEARMKRLLHIKFEAWSYESEYRVFVRLENAEKGLYFANFEPFIALREVIVGHRSEATRARVKQAIGGLKGVRAFKARPAFQRFEVTEQLNQTMWQ